MNLWSAPNNGTVKCSGSARVLQGNSATIGHPGGFSGSSVGNFPVTANGAAVIPSQALRKLREQLRAMSDEELIAFGKYAGRPADGEDFSLDIPFYRTWTVCRLEPTFLMRATAPTVVL
jgi:hypothetical protein